MELRRLRYFVAVAETRHFSRAAERLAWRTDDSSPALLRLLETVKEGLL